MLGGISDLWQREIMGIGPTGRDKGKGGKFLLLPPDHDGAVPDGYMAAKSQTYGVVFGVRGFQSSRRDRAGGLADEDDQNLSAVAGGQPAGERSSSMARARRSTRSSPTPASTSPIWRWMIEREPHDTIPSHERFQLAAIGIEKGKPFTPDAARKALLDDAARFASAIARTNSFDSDDPARLVYPDRAWEWAFIGGSASWDSQGYVNTDRRSGFAYIAIGMSPAMVEKHVGTGSQYLWTPRDASGAFLDGGKRYRLHIPAEHPGEELLVGRGLRRRQPLDPAQRPAVPVGEHVHRPGGECRWLDRHRLRARSARRSGNAKNWIQTTPGKGWFMLFRFYGPLEPFFDKTWKPDDIVEMK